MVVQDSTQRSVGDALRWVHYYLIPEDEDKAINLINNLNKNNENINKQGNFKGIENVDKKNL